MIDLLALFAIAIVEYLVFDYFPQYGSFIMAVITAVILFFGLKGYRSYKRDKNDGISTRKLCLYERQAIVGSILIIIGGMAGFFSVGDDESYIKVLWALIFFILGSIFLYKSGKIWVEKLGRLPPNYPPRL